SRFTSAETKLEEVETQQRRATKISEKLSADEAAHTQDILSQLRSTHSQIVDGSTCTANDLQQVLQASHDLQSVLEQKVDSLLWKHTKQQPVLVDFSGLQLAGSAPSEQDSEMVKVAAELAAKVDSQLSNLTAKLEAFAEEAKRRTTDQETIRRAPCCDAEVQSEVVQVAEAEIQATEVLARKKRARATRHHARASRLSLAQAKELRTGKAKTGMPVFADESEMKKNLRQALVKVPYNVHDYYRTEGTLGLR
ncbi:unnamed protein product, partial [Symbiodinium pilosum]